MLDCTACQHWAPSEGSPRLGLCRHPVFVTALPTPAVLHRHLFFGAEWGEDCETWRPGVPHPPIPFLARSR